MDNEWNDNNKLSSIINNCINIEDNIKNINIINENIKKCKVNKEINIEFCLGVENDDNYIKCLGQLYDKFAMNSSIIKNKDHQNK